MQGTRSNQANIEVLQFYFFKKIVNSTLGQPHGSFKWTGLLALRPTAHPRFPVSPSLHHLPRDRFLCNALWPPSPFKKRGEEEERTQECAPLHPPPEDVRRGQARVRWRRRRAGGGAPGLLRGPQGGGRRGGGLGLGVPAGRGAQDPAQERRHEGGDAAGGLRHRPRRVREAHHGEGHRRVHQEGIRQEPRPDLALHRRPQLWFICDARNKLLCVFLHRFKSRLAIQVWVIGAADAITLACLHPVTLLMSPFL